MAFFSAPAAGVVEAAAAAGAALAVLICWARNKALALFNAIVFKSFLYLVFLSVFRILLSTRRGPELFCSVTVLVFLAGLFLYDCLRVLNTMPFLSAVGAMPTVLRCTRPLNLYEFLPFKLLASLFQIKCWFFLIVFVVVVVNIKYLITNSS